MLELGDANPYTTRAYRRAAETIRSTAAPVAELVRTGRVRELRGIGPGIEARLRELVETGGIAELAELEEELAPDLVGLGRYLGLSARKSVQIAARPRRQHRGGAARGGRRRAPARRARRGPEDGGAAAGGARSASPETARGRG